MTFQLNWLKKLKKKRVIIFNKTRKIIITDHANDAFNNRNEEAECIKASVYNAKIILKNKNHIYMKSESLKYPCLMVGQDLIVKSTIKENMKMIPYD
ncbi:hypothetical protein CON35_18110 [Bacillus cereus]|jgi:hypothetical protein|nr:hypothetical protein BK722_20645 [Bacillus thuringiensis serovar finitimus]PEF63496.1 hypothetical protein CON35_18110 [Bacillus cereus]